MRPVAYIAHDIPGRMRIRVPDAKGNPTLVRDLVDKLGKVSGIESVEASATTGSVLLHYDPELHGELGRMLKGSGESTMPLRIEEPARRKPTSRPQRRKRPPQSALARAISETSAALDDAIREATDNQLDLRVLMPLAMAGIGLMIIRRPAATPLWLTLMIFAFNSFMSLQGPALDEEIAAAEASAELLA